jgi:threonyl-tRNA synthetase
MIHCALLGSIERFLSVYIEHTAGWFPCWCAPEQMRILTLNDDVADYVKKVEEELKLVRTHFFDRDYKIRYTVDDRNESLGKKIREATKMKIPFVLIVGPKDAEAEQVSVRWTEDGNEAKIDLKDLKKYLVENIEKSF